MRMRIMMGLAVVLLLSVGLTTAAGAHKPSYAASQQLCLSAGGDFSTKAGSSYYRPFYKKQGVLWTCTSYSDMSATGQLGASCSGDGGQQWEATSPGQATCWKNAQL